jgi:hypothetical protein
MVALVNLALRQHVKDHHHHKPKFHAKKMEIYYHFWHTKGRKRAVVQHRGYCKVVESTWTVVDSASTLPRFPVLLSFLLLICLSEEALGGQQIAVNDWYQSCTFMSSPCSCDKWYLPDSQVWISFCCHIFPSRICILHYLYCTCALQVLFELVMKGREIVCWVNCFFYAVNNREKQRNTSKFPKT